MFSAKFGTSFVDNVILILQMNQTTIKKSVVTHGIGLHTGVTVNLTLKPAPENSGYIFVRTDLDDFEIPASIEYISHCSYATTLVRRGVLLSTCEHLLAALRGSNIDNCFIELDSIEIPILDGSSENWLELIEKSGIVEQNAPRHFLKILKKVEFEQGDRRMSVEPAEGYEIECLIDFPHPLINRQTFNFTLTDGAFGREIAAARTFGFTTEIEMLRRANLALGGSLNNAIILTPDGMLNEKPLRYMTNSCAIKPSTSSAISRFWECCFWANSKLKKAGIRFTLL